MKYILAFIIPFLFTTQSANAQAWTKDSKVISLGIGATNYYHVGKTRARLLGRTYRSYSAITGLFSVEGEFGIHDYVGIGFITGIGGGLGRISGYRGSLNVPMGVLANFHFYQLIADKTGKNLHQDELDIFAGVSVGSGIGIIFYKNNSLKNQLLPLAFGGAHLGIRWYFSENVGLTGQVGFGKSLVNVGIVFKL